MIIRLADPSNSERNEMETGNVDKNLSSEERQILQFLRDAFKKSSKLPTIEETSRALNLPYDEELAEKMIRNLRNEEFLE
jgi:hypothetical protein